MTSATRRDLRALAIQAAVFVAAIAAANAGLAWYGPGHFVPEQKLAAALRSPAPAIVVSGDSRMVAATDFAILRDVLARDGIATPVDDLTLGAVDTTGQAVTYRAYRDQKPAPSVFVLGIAGDSLLEPETALEPDALLGNQAVVSVLSRAGDVFAHYPGFPLAHLDPGLRFLLARVTPMGAYKSLLWMKVRVAQDRLVGGAGKRHEEVNEFGLVGDMADFAAALRGRAEERLRGARLPDGSGWKLGPWFEWLRASLRRDGTPLVLVELPMPDAYREGVSSTPEGRALKQWLAAMATSEGGHFIDLSDGPTLGLTDADFPDRLHMSPRAARLVSDRLARELSDYLRGRASGAK